MLIWLLLSCALSPCPVDEDLFDPGDFDIPPESTFDVVGCDGSGHHALIPGTTVVWCTPEWCAVGYEGSYCVPEDAFDSWWEDLGIGIDCQPKGGPGGVPLYYIECVQCEGRCV